MGNRAGSNPVTRTKKRKAKAFLFLVQKKKQDLKIKSDSPVDCQQPVRTLAEQLFSAEQKMQTDPVTRTDEGRSESLPFLVQKREQDLKIKSDSPVDCQQPARTLAEQCNSVRRLSANYGVFNLSVTLQNFIDQP